GRERTRGLRAQRRLLVWCTGARAAAHPPVCHERPVRELRDRPSRRAAPGAARTTFPLTSMTRKSPVNKLALVCNYLPRQCGIATFSHDVSEAITTEYPDTECLVVPVNDRPEGYDYPPEVRFE